MCSPPPQAPVSPASYSSGGPRVTQALELAPLSSLLHMSPPHPAAETEVQLRKCGVISKYPPDNIDRSVNLAECVDDSLISRALNEISRNFHNIWRRPLTRAFSFVDGLKHRKPIGTLICKANTCGCFGHVSKDLHIKLPICRADKCPNFR